MKACPAAIQARKSSGPGRGKSPVVLAKTTTSTSRNAEIVIIERRSSSVRAKVTANPLRSAICCSTGSAVSIEGCLNPLVTVTTSILFCASARFAIAMTDMRRESRMRKAGELTMSSVFSCLVPKARGRSNYIPLAPEGFRDFVDRH